jgi:hypothetical protein
MNGSKNQGSIGLIDPMTTIQECALQLLMSKKLDDLINEKFSIYDEE